ncbi:peptidase S51 [Acidipropionibacterium jensenii]|uniref:peptidase S51 n=1 Tax=Acidipropionibacterium jensenii TaxID=1749 RepID=UPI0026496C85|nr:peptidase S51 [Acidipropionibacterium jensenii]MDN5996070.1 peptidase S51 [Acidipropionibacterium jensenii]
MSFFLVGGGSESPEGADGTGLDEVYDAFIEEARSTGRSTLAVVVCGSPESAEVYSSPLAQIVTTRWPQAQIRTIRLTDEPPLTPLEGLDELAGIIVGGGRVADYLAGLGPSADQLSRLVRGGSPWLGFSAGAMATAVTAIEGGWHLQGRQIYPEAASEGFDELALAQGLGLVSITCLAHNDTCGGDGLLISAIDSGLLSSAVAVDEGTCLVIHHSSGRTQVMGSGVVRWFTKDPQGVIVRSERSPHKEVPPPPAAPRFAGMARVAAAARAAHQCHDTEKTGPTGDTAVPVESGQ